jgi:hypothetical protein
MLLDSVTFRLVPNTTILKSSFNLMLLWSVEVSKFYELLDSTTSTFYDDFYDNDLFVNISNELGCKKVIDIDQ